MSLYHIKAAVRYLRVIRAYPRAGQAYFCKLISLLWLFSLDSRDEDPALLERKEKLRRTEGAIGFATNSRTIVLRFLSLELMRVRLEEGPDLTAYNFFLNRPVKDLELLLELCNGHIDLNQVKTVFDPGCGTGRHLYYFIDKFGCQGVGVDIYGPAIEVGNTASVGNEIKLIEASTLDEEVIPNAIPQGCDLVFINSWMNHVFHISGYKDAIVRLLSATDYMVLISGSKYEMEELFPDMTLNVLMETSRGKARYALIKGNRSID